MRGFLFLAAAFALGPASASPVPAKISAIVSIPLHQGVNIVPHFMPDGSSATIVQAWRGNGNAHGYSDWLVLAPSSEGNRAGVVTLVDPRRTVPNDLIRDEPFDGERVIETIRFARGRVNGARASLMLDARLDATPSGIFAERAPAMVRIFQLVATDGTPGETPYEFRLISSIHTTKHYCNAELALAQTLRIPLGARFAGPNRVDGCFPG